MAVYKDEKRNTWYFRVYVEDKYGNKKQKCRSGFKTKKEAREQELKFLSIVNRNYTSMTFQDLYNTYIKHKKQTLKPKSYITYENIFINQILPYFKDFKLHKIDNLVYLDFKENILKKELSFKYNSIIHGCMVSILKYAVDFYGLKENIASKVGGFAKNNYIPKVDFWTYEEFSKFISQVKELEYRTLFITLYFTGMRIGECLALNWHDINNNYININKTLSRGGKGENNILQRPKTFSSIRKIAIDNYTINILKELKKYYKNYVGFNEEWFVFGGLKPLARTTITKKKDDYSKLAEVKKIRIHDFRHSHATLLLSKGVPLTVISKRLGHKDLSTTLNKYSHLVPEDETKAINLINNLNTDF